MILTIYYDGNCPLCMIEMQQLKSHDNRKNINFVNLHDENFLEKHPHISTQKAMKILHGQLNTGELLLGLDVTCKAWDLVGKHKWLVILRWPVIRIFTDAVYLLFARYRHRISSLLTNKNNCKNCQL